MNQQDMNQLAVNAIRVFSIDAIQKAKSGHPGTPLGAAPIGWELFAHHLKCNPKNPDWADRDRFILSAGHASMLLYSLLYLLGYGLEAEDLAAFRQWGSKTPGHPEYGVTPGVEMSTGPLGQGISTAVGFALAESVLAAKFNRPGREIVDHYTYVLAGDGCFQEGVSGEAASFAGTQKLGKLIVLYDRNGITIEGDTDLAFTEDVGRRYEAYGWQVLECEDARDMKNLGKQIEKARREKDKPSLIIVHSVIGESSPLAGSEKTHGSPLGEENVRLTKERLGWDPGAKAFQIPQELEEEIQRLQEDFTAREEEWNALFALWKDENPELAREWEEWHKKEILLSELDIASLRAEKDEATRKSSGRVINKIAGLLPNFIGGSADLAPSNNTWIDGGGSYSPENRLGRNIHFGVREFAMACIMNGINLHGGLRAYCATFFVFSDYMRNAIRLAALMDLPSIFVFTHDSIGVGEDGPTHQPIEQLASLRAIPNLQVLRPADAVETAAAWKHAIESGRPTALVLSRQNLPQLETSSADGLLHGAYILKDDKDARCLLMASGSEVSLALSLHEELHKKGIPSRLVSFPSMELFNGQSEAYRESVLPSGLNPKFAIEAAHPMPWYRYVGTEGKVHGIDHFGASSPASTLFREYGFDLSTLEEEISDLLK